MNWSPERAAALERLRRFAPHAGADYARRRNHDLGPGDRSNVSALSPWIGCRRLAEPEVLAAVLAVHGPGTAEKFIQEVCWRTWSKGWLERHPETWTDWLDECARDRERLEREPGLAAAWQAAVDGRTGIECFDAWARELVDHGYLHNHARMWFASIWVFTLGLPWSLGAAFFLRHLLDGDAASNTLGWRWVAGLQTPGKTYRATADNIARCTNGRFRPRADQLASSAPAPEGIERPPAAAAPAPPDPPAPDATTGLLLTPDDLGFETLPVAGIAHCAIVDPARLEGDAAPAAPVRRFRRGAIDDTVAALEAAGVRARVVEDAETTAAWCAEHDLRRVLRPWTPVGPVRDAIAPVLQRLHDAGREQHDLLRGWDARAWPHAGKGFFPFRRRIPDLLEAEDLA